jgi:peroxiredoxin
MALRIGDTAPDFQAQTTEGTIERGHAVRATKVL